MAFQRLQGSVNARKAQPLQGAPGDAQASELCFIQLCHGTLLCGYVLLHGPQLQLGQADQPGSGALLCRSKE